MKTRETLKNLLIVVLVFGMAFLTVVTWSANNPNSEFFRILSGRNGEVSDLELPDVDAYPLTVSIRTAEGRYSAVHDASAVEFAYSQTEDVLRHAIQSAKNRAVIDETTWNAALTKTASVLYDYQCDVPMSVFAFWYGHENPELFEEFRVRHLCLVSDGNTVRLLGKNAERDTYFSFATEVKNEELLGKLAVFHAGVHTLGVEEGRTETPELILSGEVPQVTELRAVNVASTFGDQEIDVLLRCFELNPNMVSRHVEQDGSRVFVEENSTVKITADGVATYSDLRTDLEYNSGLTVKSAHETATVWEKAEAARELVSAIDVLTSSSGRLYPEEIRENAGTVEVLFGREVGGVPIDFGGDRAIARVKIQGNRISEVEFVLRSYTKSTAKCILMPSKLAAATEDTGKELFLRYPDTAQERVLAEWYLK